MDPSVLQKPVREFFQRRRLKNFLSEYAGCRNILDVGGAHYTWTFLGRTAGITVLNVLPPGDTGSVDFVCGSGMDIPFQDQAFDLAFSNSAIEHVGSESDQFKFASEMLRVGKRVYCQTPSRFFPVDPHLSALFVHWLPKRWLTPALLRYCTLNGWLWKRPYEYDVTWISKRKLRKMFPGCTIKTERFLLLAKSYIVIGSLENPDFGKPSN